MPLISNRYVPTGEVKRITVGSFEERARLIESAVNSDAVRLFGTQVESKVVGTFPGHAVVLAEDGACVRVKYEINGNVAKLLSFDRVADTVESRHSFLNVQAKEAATLLSQGRISEAKAVIKHLATLVDSASPQQDDQIVDAMISFRRADRPWKATFREKADTMRRLVLDEAGEIHKDRIQPKFKSLHNGTLKSSEVDRYRDLVIESIKILDTRTTRLQEQVESAIGAVKALKIEDPSVGSYLSFSHDLADSLQSNHKTITEGLRRVKRTDSLGKLHDSLAEEFSDCEVASRYVISMSKRLGDAP